MDALHFVYRAYLKVKAYVPGGRPILLLRFPSRNADKVRALDSGAAHGDAVSGGDEPGLVEGVLVVRRREHAAYDAVRVGGAQRVQVIPAHVKLDVNGWVELCVRL